MQYVFSVKYLQILRVTTIIRSWGDIMFEDSVKRVHAPGGIKCLRLVRNCLSDRGGCSDTIP